MITTHIACGFRAQELDQPATAGFFAKVGLTVSSPRETHCCILRFHRSPGPQIFRVQPTVTIAQFSNLDLMPAIYDRH